MYHAAQRKDSTVVCLQRSARTWQALGNHEEQLSVLSDLFSVYNTLNDYPQALNTLQQGLRVIDRVAPGGPTARPAATFLTYVSFYYFGQHDYDAARRYGQQGVHRLALAHDSLGMVSVLAALSVAEQELHQPALAEQHARCAVRLASRGGVVTEPGPPLMVMKALTNMADVEQRLGHAAAAVPYAQEAEKMQAPLGILVLKSDLACVQSAIYQDLGQPARALACFKSYIATRDSTSTEATRRAVLMQRMSHQSQLKEAALRTAQQKQQAQAQAEIRHQKLLRWLGLAGAALLLAAAAGWYAWQRAHQRATQALEAQRLVDLQALDRLKTTFSTNISHEFRTPLTLILGPAETLAADTPVATPATPPLALPDSPLTNPAALAALPPLDQRFLEKVAALLDQHLADEGFGVDQLSEALALSRTQVNRKLKALTGQSPGECLRLTRLHRALALLQVRTGAVADIAYQVGYRSPAHFSTAFSRQFGFLPSAAHKQGAAG